MATYDHLPLRRLEGAFERRKHGFGQAPERDPAGHGARVSLEIDETIEAFRTLPSIDGIDPSLILKIRTTGGITDDVWQQLGLTVLGTDGDQTVILFASDTMLTEFKRRVAAYQGELPLGQKHPSYNMLVASVDGISLLSPEDRIGPLLRANGHTTPETFEPNTSYLLDFELHRPPTAEEADLFVYRLQAVIAQGGVVLSTYAGQSLLIVRAECKGIQVRAALDLAELSVVDLPPEPDVAAADLSEIDLETMPTGSAPPTDAVVVGIIDSGVNFGHPLLAPTEAGAIALDPSWSVSDTFGHGTRVASIAAFGDIAARAQAENFDAKLRIASARVLTDDGHFPRNLSLPELMDRSIRQLHEQFGCRIFNLSLGDERKLYTGGKPDPWAAALDGLARELDILIIVSAGNRSNLTASFGDGIVAAYPHFLAEPESRIIEPATAAIAVTVGAIAHSNGLAEDDDELAGVRPICALEEPSPFSRGGPGVLGMIKPDFVDFGGNAVWDGPTGTVVNGMRKPSAGIWTFHPRPLERLFTTSSGTSFAAPNLAYKAGLLLSEFEGASSNLIRSLLGLSATVPAAVRQRPLGLDTRGIMTTCGHGVPNAEHAATSDDGRVVFYAEDKLKLDHFAVFEIPIPTDFQSVKGAREIRVSLAFDPPVRHTRVDYLGTTMGWRLLRGASQKEVFDRFRKWAKEEGKPPKFADRNVCPTEPGSTLREKGALQIGTYTGKTDISGYGDLYYVAVWCSRRWAPAAIIDQKFALSVQLRHESANTLYASLTQPVRVRT